MKSTSPLLQNTQDDPKSGEEHHVPVMVHEVTELMAPLEPRIIVDGTCGAGGHALRLLKTLPCIERIFCIDWDSHALEIARKRLAGFEHKAEFIHANYKDLVGLLPAYDTEKVDAILLDLGISTMHLKESGRGFSFLKDEPIDMRMDETGQVSALDLIRELSEEQLSDIIWTYGEERWAKRIVRIAKEYCTSHKLPTSKGLAQAISSAIPRRFHPRRIHPATRTFQALRIAVNREMDNLKAALHSFPEILRPGGRIICIAFHSLEDRLIKHAFKKDPRLVPLTKRPMRPSEKEVALNPRARSAKLRCAEKVFNHTNMEVCHVN